MNAEQAKVYLALKAIEQKRQEALAAHIAHNFAKGGIQSNTLNTNAHVPDDEFVLTKDHFKRFKK